MEPNFDAYAPEGVGVALMASIGGITYNTDLVRGHDVPRRLEALLQPKWHGLIAATPVPSACVSWPRRTCWAATTW